MYILYPGSFLVPPCVRHLTATSLVPTGSAALGSAGHWNGMFCRSALLLFLHRQVPPATTREMSYRNLVYYINNKSFKPYLKSGVLQLSLEKFNLKKSIFISPDEGL